MKTGIELIAEERQRQISVKGWTADHDDTHVDGAMAIAAACYASPSPIYVQRRIGEDTFIFNDPWPWGHVVKGRSCEDADTFLSDSTRLKKLSKSRIDQLVIAGALIAAEIDRVNRVKKDL